MAKQLSFDGETLRKLEQLSLVASRVRIGLLKGERRSRKRGSSIEFADYRDYSQGDDLRRLDWNVFARLERPFIKLLEDEEDLAVHILVDASGSMDWPPEDDEKSKFHYAIRLAGALGYISLIVGDLVSVSWLSEDSSRGWGPFRGRQNALSLFQYLEAGQARGRTDINQAAKNYGLRSHRPGLLIMISDLFSADGYDIGIKSLLSRGYEVVLLQILSNDEINPRIGGDVKLVDKETSKSAELSLDASTVAEFTDRFRNWQQGIASYSAKNGIQYLSVTTETPWDKLVLHSLRERNVIR